jgi:hypothetical protein
MIDRLISWIVEDLTLGRGILRYVTAYRHPPGQASRGRVLPDQAASHQ